MVVIDVRRLSAGEPTVDQEEAMIEQAQDLAGEGQDVTLTGLAPVWLYLMVAHALAGRVRTLWFDSPGIPKAVLIFGNLPKKDWR